MSERYDVILLAVNRQSERISDGLGDLPLRSGDVLLVRGATSKLWQLRKETGVELLSDVRESSGRWFSFWSSA